MNERILYKLTSALWTAIVLFVVALALYISVGRFLMNSIAQVQVDLLRELNARLNFAIEVDELSGRWESLTPYLEMKGLRVLGNTHHPLGLEVEELVLGFDLLGSLRSRGLQLYSLVASGVTLHGDVSADGRFEMPGIPVGDGILVDQLLRFVLNTEHLSVENFELSLHTRDRERRLSSHFRLVRDEQFRRLNMSVFSPAERSWFRIVGEGNGDPFQPERFEAELHMLSHISDVENYADLAALLGVQVERGSLESELWFSTREGLVRSAAKFAATDFVFTPPGEFVQQVELDELSSVVRLDKTAAGWEFAATDIVASGVEQQFLLDGISGLLSESELKFQIADVDVAHVVAYALTEKLLPENRKDLFQALAPSGHFTRLQIIVDDLEQWATSWRIEANFEDLAVASWRGMPTIRNGSGYLNLTREDGTLQLDATDFAIGFPAVYRHMLAYSEFQTELAFSVEADRFDLWSGRFRGLGDEGELAGLFALSVPFEETVAGIEIDLLVGMENGHPRSRHKYLPFTLPKNLLRWLENSLGDGLITEGGFIYRGSLRKGLLPHRSLQLFFNVEDSELDYHADWPGLSNLDATLYVDNTAANAYASQATLYGSLATEVAVELLPGTDGEWLLNVEGKLNGPAQDGLAVVNNSPIRKRVGDAFTEWRLHGAMESRVRFSLDLKDLRQTPQVDIAASLDDVLLNTGRLGLEVEALTGDLNYHTDTGFSAAEITGSLWNQPLVARVSQGRSEAGTGLNDLDIQVNSFVESAAIRKWLKLDLIRLAEGGADAEMHIVVPPGSQPRLRINSDLVGVSLDLPQQFAKAAETARPLSVSMPISSGDRDITLNMDDSAWLNLRLNAEGLQAAGIGFSRPQAADVENRLVVGGAVSRLDWEPWLAFIQEYVRNDGENVDSSTDLLVSVQDLAIGELHALEQMITDARISAHQQDRAWQLSYTTDWVSGVAAVPDDFSLLGLDIDHLDLDKLPQSMLESLTGSEPSAFELPAMEVSIAGLTKGEERLGHIQFALQKNGDDYHFGAIRGELRGLLLDVDQALTLDWRRDSEGSSTALRGPIRFLNFGDVLVNYGYDQIIETNSGAFDLDLRWRGAPSDFALVNIQGQMHIAIDDGSFLKSSAAAAGTLKVMGILNLAEFVRRLSFDMNYLFKSGIPFDSITGDLIFEKGLIEVPQIDILGASSRFQFVGLVDAKAATIDGEMVTTLPVASNLPWIAALIGGLPAAAGVYLVSKVFTEQVDRFSSGIYGINGPWEDPQVKFQRIFDNTASHQQAVADAEVEPPPEVVE